MTSSAKLSRPDLSIEARMASVKAWSMHKASEIEAKVERAPGEMGVYALASLGDLGCHKLSTVFKALKLGAPISVEGSAAKINPETYPMGEIVRFEFPVRGSMPPVTLTWYDLYATCNKNRREPERMVSGCLN